MARPPKPKPITRPRLPDWLDRAALIVVLLTVCARAMMQERSEDETLSIVSRLQGAVSPQHGPGPTLSLVFDGLILASATCCAVAGSLGGRRRRVPAGLIALGLMIAAATLSLTNASNLRLALTESANRIAAVMVLLVIARTVRRWWEVRLVLAAIGATAAAFAVFAVNQVYVEQPDTLKWIEQQKAQAIQEGRFREDDPTLRLLEARARSGEAGGFFVHSNIAGGYLAVVALATLALGAAKLRVGGKPLRGFFGAVGIGIALLLAFAVWLASSRAAIAAGVLMSVVWLVGALLWDRWPAWRKWVTHRRKALLIAGWVTFAAALGGVAAIGLTRGSLPTLSLAYRWQYWTGAARVIAQHPLLGIGAGNFDRHYVRYKPIEWPEEVRDPHNVLITTLTEWGPIGLAGLLMLWGGVSWGFVRTGPERDVLSDKADRAPPTQPPGRLFLWLALFACVALAARTLASPAELWVIWALPPTMIAAVAFTALALDSNQMHRFEDDPLPLLGGIGAAVLIAVIHNMISFAMIYPGSACTFYALAGLGLAVRGMRDENATAREAAPPSQAGRSNTVGMVLSTIALAVLVMYWPVFVTPVRSAGEWLAEARSARSVDAVMKAYTHAIAADPLDASAPSEAARWAIAGAQQGKPELAKRLAPFAVEAAETAAIRDRGDNQHYRTLSSAYLVRFRVSHDPNDLDRAAEAARAAVTLYPELPDLRADLGEVLALQGRVRNDPSHTREALEQMQRALALEDRRPASEIRRMAEADRQHIALRIADLTAELAKADGTTTATTTTRSATGPAAP